MTRYYIYRKDPDRKDSEFKHYTTAKNKSERDRIKQKLKDDGWHVRTEKKKSY